MQKTSTFLASNIDMVPFKFLGVKVGGSPKRYSIWGPTIDKLKKRLSLWKGIHLNMGERVVLMNSFIRAIPIYVLSFYKALTKV